ncbi:MAG TPA: methyltransferase domain-containing protein [Kofleriaceae bacterium]
MKQDWDQVANVSHCMGQMLSAASSKFLELGNLGRGQRVLDLACGVGTVAAQAGAIVGEGGWVVGLDSSPEMVAVANQYFGGGDTVKFAVHDVLDPVGHPDSYDTVFCRFSLPFLTNPGIALAGSFAALKPGGRMCIMSIADFRDNDFIRVLEVIDSPLVNHVLQWGTPQAIANEVAAAGFQGVLTKRIRALVTVNDPNVYWHCIRGLFGFADPIMPPALARHVVPGTRLGVSFVFALGRKPDPDAPVDIVVQTPEDTIAVARRKTREISATSLGQTFKGEPVVYLDVRAPGSRVTKIKDSINITRDDLEKQLPAMVPDPSTIIVVYCQSGNQSALATTQLDALGYRNVWSLQRGIEGWEYVGKRVVPA